MRQRLLKTTAFIGMVIAFFGFGAFGACAQGGGEKNKEVSIPSGIDHSAWDQLLKKYVNDKGLVDYAAWKNNPADMKAIGNYLDQFAAKPSEPAKGKEKAASLINAYNAIAIKTILDSYPVESIHETDKPFKARNWMIGGEKVSLNDIENGTLRPMLKWQAHSVLVCAARSCPPLQRHAYSMDKLDQQVADAYKDWLAREELNKFQLQENQAEISKVFDWFKKDFEQSMSVPKVIAKFGPAEAQKLTAGGDEFKVSYLSYNWGLNDQGEHGRDYSKADLVFDNIF